MYFRLDLTSEKRYTLKKISKKILRDLNDIVYIQVYLDGDLPVGLKKMQKNIKEQLDEYRIYTNGNLQYNFINPSEDKNNDTRKEFFKDLFNRGLAPINIQNKDKEGGTSQKIIFPGAIIRYQGKEMAINLLRNNKNLSAEQNLNISIENLEYEFITAINNLCIDSIKKIAFIEGHGELDPYETGDITKEIAKYYQVDRGKIDHVASLDNYIAIIIAKPQKAFTEKEKFTIDQYIMNGGKVLWFIDAVDVNMDSLATGTTFGNISELNLSDILFKYGVRINPVLLKDLHCNIIPISTSYQGGQAKFVPTPWLYYPLFVPSQNNIITKGVDLIKSEFVNTIDTLNNGTETKKIILLNSSTFSKTIAAPLMISLAEVKENPDQRLFNSSFPVAVILDGQFNSVFTNRIFANLIDVPDFVYKNKSIHTKMLVVADGDIIKNEVRMTANGPMLSPLGFDKYSNQNFGNKDFVMNCIHFLVDDKGLIELRSKDLSLRLLNRSKINAEKTKWITINTVIPVLLIILIAWIVSEIRKKRFAQ